MTPQEELHAALEQLDNLVYQFEDEVAQLGLSNQLEDTVAQLGLLNLTFRRLLKPCPDSTPSAVEATQPTLPT